MSSIRERAISMLAAGVAQHLVADAVGVTPGYISVLAAEPEVRAEIAEARAATVQEHLTHDKLISKIEMDALRVVEKKLPFVKAPEAAKIFAQMNAARRHALLSENDATTVQNVTIVLPAAAEAILKKNRDNQVIDIDGKSIAPLPSRALPALANRVAEEEHQARVEIVTQLMAPTDVEVVAPHVSDFRAKQQERDQQLAAARLNASKDFRMMLDGVEVVL